MKTFIMVPNTYSQIYFQLVFAVKHRKNLIQESWEEELHRFIAGVIRKEGQRLYIINGMPDHIHILIGLDADRAPSEITRRIKSNSSRWINEKGFVRGRFRWQKGFGAFTYHQSMLPRVIAYIERQKEHHRKFSFKEEYKGFLEKFEVDYDERYLFEFYDGDA